MENFGIDIGDFKTVITGSSRNGRILKDNLGNRSISTQIQLSTPRQFGNNFFGFKKDDLIYRYRHFFNCTENKCAQECQDLMTMYLCYLNRVIHSNLDRPGEVDKDKFKPNVSFSTKTSSLSDIHKMIMSSEAANLSVGSVFDDLTAAASNLALKIRKIEDFALIDFGHSQTGIGLFSFRNSHLIAKKIKRLHLGGGHFDEKIFYHILSQCGLKENSNFQQSATYRGHAVDSTTYKPVDYEKDHKFYVLKESIIPRIKKYKMILSNSNSVEDTLEFGDDLIQIKVLQSDYKEMIKEEIEKIKDFILKSLEEFKNITSEFEIEVLGGNSNNVFIKEMLNENEIKTLQSTDSHEGVAFGTSIAGALPFYTKTVTVSDCLVGDVKLNDHVIFKDGDLIEREVSLVQENDELLIVLDSGKKTIQQDKKENSEEHTIKIPYDKTITITHNDEIIFQQSPQLPCAIVLNRNKTVSIKGRPVIDDVSHLLEFEKKYRKSELDIEKIGIINNDFQLFLEKLEGLMSVPNYFALFKEEEISQVSDISLEYMYAEISTDLKKEQEKIDGFRTKIDPFIKRMKDLVDEKKAILMELIEKSLVKLKNTKTFTPSVFKLQSRLNGDKLKLENCTFDGDLSVLNVEILEEDIVKMEIEIEKEILEKEKEEKEREEKERIAKEELEKQKKEKESKKEKEMKEEKQKESTGEEKNMEEKQDKKEDLENQIENEEEEINKENKTEKKVPVDEKQ